MNRYFLGIVFLLMISFSVAQPQFQTSASSSKSIIIEMPVVENQKLNTNFTYHLHAHNSSDGKLLPYSVIDYCTIHMYNPSDGRHLIQDNMSQNGNGFDWEYLVLGGNFSEANKHYAVYTYCEVNSSIESLGGFFEFSFEVTNEGTQLSLWDSIVRMFLLLFFVGIFLLIHQLSSKINFEKWNNKIMEKYKTRNFVKMVLSSIVYNIMKNSYIIYYLIGLPVLLVLKDITYTYNISNMILFIDVVLSIYLIGVLIVGIIFLSYVQEWIMEAWEMVRDMDWGVGK